MKTIRVPFVPHEDETMISIPVIYSVEEKSSELSFIHCRVDLRVEEVPEWLYPQEFIIKRYYKTGITIHTVMADSYRTVDASLFASRTVDHIRVKETNDRNFLR